MREREFPQFRARAPLFRPDVAPEYVFEAMRESLGGVIVPASMSLGEG